MREPTRSRRLPSRLPALAFAAGLSLLAWAGVASIGAPPQARPGPVAEDEDDAAFELQVLQRAVSENCLMCHSEDLIRSQRLTAPQWKAVVEKMVGWGSPLPAELREPVTAYLTAEYSSDMPPWQPDVLPLRSLARAVDDRERPHDEPGGDAHRGESLYAQNCANCHGKGGEGAELGTNLVEKPVLVAPDDYQAVVRGGRGRMPGFAALLNPEAEADILAWLRTRRYEPYGDPGR